MSASLKMEKIKIAAELSAIMTENEIPKRNDVLVQKSGSISPDTERDTVNDILETDEPIILVTEHRLITIEEDLEIPDLSKVIGVNDVKELPKFNQDEKQDKFESQ